MAGKSKWAFQNQENCNVRFRPSYTEFSLDCIHFFQQFIPSLRWLIHDWFWKKLLILSCFCHACLHSFLMMFDVIWNIPKCYLKKYNIDDLLISYNVSIFMMCLSIKTSLTSSIPASPSHTFLSIRFHIAVLANCLVYLPNWQTLLHMSSPVWLLYKIVEDGVLPNWHISCLICWKALFTTTRHGKVFPVSSSMSLLLFTIV